MAEREWHHQPHEATMTEDQIKYLVNRFLGWRLPENFCPDAGISFKPFGNEGTPYQYKHTPTGTNLFDAMQAEAMVRYMIDGMPSAPPAQAAQSSEDAHTEAQAFCEKVYREVGVTPALREARDLYLSVTVPTSKWRCNVHGDKHIVIGVPGGIYCAACPPEASHLQSSSDVAGLVERLDAIGEEEMYQQPATTRKVIEEAMAMLIALSKPSADTADLVERLRFHSRDPLMGEAASALIALDAERRRLLEEREAHKQCIRDRDEWQARAEAGEARLVEAEGKLVEASAWLAKANAPGDEGCDFLNENGWDEAEELERSINATLERARAAAGTEGTDG